MAAASTDPSASMEARKKLPSHRAASHLAENLIDDYVLYRLSGPEVDFVEVHLLTYVRCQQEVEKTLIVIELGASPRELTDTPPSLR
jgi:hypothetical protein